MGLRLSVPAEFEPIGVNETKAHCRIDGSEFDLLVPGWIAAARANAENRMHAVIMQRTYEMTLDAFPYDRIELEVPPVWNPTCAFEVPLRIKSITYVDAAGATGTVAPADYLLDNANWPYSIRLAYGAEWPDARDQPNAVTVTYEVGYDDEEQVPTDVRAWLLLTVAYLKTQAELLDMSGRSTDVPNRFTDSLLDPYRVFTV